MFGTRKTQSLTVVASNEEINMICNEARYMLNERNTNRAYFSSEFAAALYIVYRACGYDQKKAYTVAREHVRYYGAQSWQIPQELGAYTQDIYDYTEYMINRTVYNYR